LTLNLTLAQKTDSTDALSAHDWLLKHH